MPGRIALAHGDWHVERGGVGRELVQVGRPAQSVPCAALCCACCGVLWCPVLCRPVLRALALHEHPHIQQCWYDDHHQNEHDNKLVHKGFSTRTAVTAVARITQMPQMPHTLPEFVPAPLNQTKTFYVPLLRLGTCGDAKNDACSGTVQKGGHNEKHLFQNPPT